MSDDPTRQPLLSVYRAALAAVNGRRCCRRFLREHRPATPVALVAIGKAASGMAQGAADALGERILRGLVITKAGHGEPLTGAAAGFDCLFAGHPVPDARSLQAGAALLAFIDALPAGVPLLLLVSGGASALVEVLPEGAGLAELQRLNDWLLGSGLDIGAMNAVRRSLSCIKGGRLARRLAGRHSLCLMISDVPGDDPGVIGSGLLAPAAAMPAAIARQTPDWLRPLQGLAPALPAAGDRCFATVESHVIARLKDALAAAADAGRGLGLAVFEHATPLSGDAASCGRRLAQRLRDGPAGLHVWGGETSVRLPARPGRGGRNQHLALAAATVLAGDAHCTLLCAGTDGSDGPGEDAGAVVDGGTLRRGQGQGLNAVEALRRADSGRFLRASGDLLRTGPTGTNVMDVVLGIKRRPGAFPRRLPVAEV